MKEVNFNIELKSPTGEAIKDTGDKWMRLIIGSQTSDKESDLLKIFSFIEKIESNPSSLAIDEGDESLLKDFIRKCALVNPMTGEQRVNSYMKAQLLKAINSAPAV